jgi:hypothetical protein
MTDLKNLFINESSIDDHVNANISNQCEYMSTVLLLLKNKMSFTIMTKAKILVASFVTYNKELTQILLSNTEFGLPEVLKCCEMLDSRRYINQLNKKITKLEGKMKKGKLGKLKTELNNTMVLNDGLQASLNKSKIKKIKNLWLNRIQKDKLEFYSMTFGTSHWKQLANYLHVKPSDFQLDWFLNYVFTNIAPEDSILTKCKTLNNETCYEMVAHYKPDYNYLRTLNLTLDDKTKALIAAYAPVDTVLWFYEELGCFTSDKTIIQRLNSGEKLTLPYGKLMERLLILKERKATNLFNTLMAIAESKLSDYNVNLQGPIALLADGSPSMDVAIRTSSIIASILCAVCNAELRIFRSDDQLIENPPRTAKEVIEATSLYKTGGCTAPASSLWPYFTNKKIVKTFIVVTDEEENQYPGGYTFAQLFARYRKQIYKSKIIFVSFIKSDNQSIMVRGIREAIPDIGDDLMQFKMDPARPDLTKLDFILGSIAVQSEKFNEDMTKLALEIKTNKENNTPMTVYV